MWTAYNLTTLALVVALFALYLLWSQIRSHRLRSRLKELQTEETRVVDFLHGIGAAFSIFFMGSARRFPRGSAARSSTA